MASPRPDLAENLRDRPLSEAITILADEEFCGILVWVTELTRRELCFADGVVYAARSNLEAEMLGQWLVDKEFITEEQRAMLLLSQSGQNTAAMGELLVAKGILERERLLEELEELTLRIVANAGTSKPSFLEVVEDDADLARATLSS